jgi:MoaA/NifB/PqqE/SkfB family radical SAM enzyme
MEPNEEFSFDEFRKIIDGISKSNLAKDSVVCIGGGEPFMHPEVREMLNYAAENLPGRELWVATNLFWLSTNPEIARKQLESIPRGINFSLPLDREHARYVPGLADRIKNLVSILKERRARWGIVSTVSFFGKLGLPRWLRKIGAKKTPDGKLDIGGSIGAFDIRPQNALRSRVRWAARNLDDNIYYHAIVSTGTYTKNLITILPDGRVVGSGNLNIFFNAPEFSLGNWRHESLPEIIDQLPQRADSNRLKLLLDEPASKRALSAAAKNLQKKFRTRTPRTKSIRA